jgi:endonuclease/exonuclease/phosphatase family metal-dependent hydrolase
MTWNVWWRFGPRWRDRQPLLLEVIRRSGADVVALQETWGTTTDTQPHVFARELGFAAAFAEPSLPPRPEPPEHPEQRNVAIGVGLLSRWPFTAMKAIPLPSRSRPFAPVALLAELAAPAGPLHVVVACTEWEASFGGDRVDQARALADLAADPTLDGDAPVIVAGDLNAAPTSPVLAPLFGLLTDAWVAAGGDPAARTLPSEHPQASDVPELIDQRIDHVLFRPGRRDRPVRATRAVIAGEPTGGLDPSDHRAVVCDLEWGL